MELRIKSLQHTFVVSVPFGATAEQVRACLPPVLSIDKLFLSAGEEVREKERLPTNCRELLLVRTQCGARCIAVHVTQGYNSITLYCTVDTSVLQLSQTCLRKLNLDPASTRLLHSDQVLSQDMLLGQLTHLTTLDIRVESTKPVNPIHGSMTLIIRWISGTTLPISVDPRITVGELKQAIGEQAQVSTLGLRLLFAGRELLDDTPLYRSGAGGGCTFHAVYRLPGG